MNDQERARALSELLEQALRGQDTTLPGTDEELRALADLGRTLSDLRAEPDVTQRAALERMLQAHRVDILRAAARRQDASRVGAPIADALAGLRLWFSGWRLPVVVGALLVMLAIAILAIVGLPGRGGEEIIARAPSPTAVSVPTSAATATAGGIVGPTREPTAVASATPLSSPTGQPTASSTPSATPIVVPPNAVALHHVRGIVEIQGADGTWVSSEVQPFVREGERIRTGALSGVEMAFYDGSVVRMGADAQITVDRLQPANGGARAIELTQWLGESQHAVAPAQDAHGWYVVHTPSGTGTALGTAFDVWVTPSLASWFSVDEGTVRVSNAGSSVVATAGQAAFSRMAEAPDRPVFRVRGEGQVTETGDVWRIAGQTFALYDATTVVGDPQLGDWVSVEGHVDRFGTRYADQIVLLRRSSIEHFCFVGQVDAISAALWTIAGQQVTIASETDTEHGLQVGDMVSVDGTIEPGGELVAAHILYRGDTTLGEAFSYVGVVQSVSESAWVVSDVELAVNGETATDPGLLVGSVVLVRGDVLEDGTWLARSIRKVSSQERTFEFVGEVDQVDPWIVAGIDLETGLYTVIDEGIGEDDRVRVQGIVLDDGTRVAEAIKWDDQDGTAFAFVGTVEQTEPWQVSGVALAVDDDTEIGAGIGVDSLVRVTGHLSGEMWVAERIELAQEARHGAGCTRQYSVVLELDQAEIVLLDGVRLARGGSLVEIGTLDVGSVVEVWRCVDDSGQVQVVSITVLGEVDVTPYHTPTVEPSPVPSQDVPRGEPDQTSGEEPTPTPEPNVKWTICHNPGPGQQTIEVADEAVLNAHLAHGDYMGPCQDLPTTEEQDRPPKPTKKPKPDNKRN
jgi:hypothetical protein